MRFINVYVFGLGQTVVTKFCLLFGVIQLILSNLKSLCSFLKIIKSCKDDV